MRFLLSLIKYRKIVLRIAYMDFRKRYFGTLLGSSWAILMPAVTIGLIYFVLTFGLKPSASDGVAFADWLIPGMLAWFFISETMSLGVYAITENVHLVKKVQFPLHLLVPSRTISALPVHLLLISLFLLYLLAMGVGTYSYWFQLVYYLFCACVLTLGVNYIASTIQVFIRDAGNVISTAMQIFFWITPLFWNPNRIAGSGYEFILYSPLNYIVTGYRESLFEAIPFWEKPFETAIFWLVALFLLVTGVCFFQRARCHFADVL